MGPTKKCWTCHEEKDISLFTRDAAKKDGYSGRCAACSRKANLAANKDQTKAIDRSRRYREAHPELEAARRLADKEASALRLKKWAKENVEKQKAHVYVKTATRRARKIKATVAWANKFFIAEAYALARLRTKTTGVVWHVDHIIPLKGKIVCGLHVEHNMMVIPATTNRAKGNKLEVASWL